MIPGPQTERFLEIAESLKPVLSRVINDPVGTIDVVKDDAAILGWRAVPLETSGEDKILHKGDSVIFDFGELTFRRGNCSCFRGTC
jgi:hypothetical protein